MIPTLILLLAAVGLLTFALALLFLEVARFRRTCERIANDVNLPTPSARPTFAEPAASPASGSADGDPLSAEGGRP
jgi:hypothetical protein